MEVERSNWQNRCVLRSCAGVDVVQCQRRGAPKTSVSEGGGDPRTLASRRHWLLQVVAAFAGVSAIVSSRFPSSSSLPAFVTISLHSAKQVVLRAI